MKDQKKRGDGLVWIGKLFRPRLVQDAAVSSRYTVYAEKDPKAMGRGVRRMPFRKAKSRDVWEQSPEAASIGEQWNEVRRGGGKVSFANDSDESSISSE